MLECLHDTDIQKGFKKKMQAMTMDDVVRFIKSAQIRNNLSNGMDIHYAVVNTEEDEYLGTVSLKNIDLVNGTAEYAIITRKKAHGRGIGFKATGLILKKAFLELHLRRVYLSVYSDNNDAIKLYEKCGFRLEGEFRKHFIIDGKYIDWRWYGILNDEYNEEVFLDL